MNKEAVAGLHGVFFLRSTPKAITAANIYTDVNQGTLSPTLLQSLTGVMKHVLLPALKAQEQWGVLKKENDIAVKVFMETLENFVIDIDLSLLNLEQSLKLPPCTVDLSPYKLQSNYVDASAHPDIITSLQHLVTEWCKQVEKVLAESEQMRKEADDVGPNAELAHWKARMIKFNCIYDQLKSASCQQVVGILTAAKVRNLVKTWQDLEVRIADAANEAKDNVKYLHTLDRYCAPIYQSDPVGMIAAIPGLINAIKMVHGMSQHYNTSERMTSIFVKITNQMITSCKSYIYESGTNLWEQNRPKLVERLIQCGALNEAYQKCFHDTKENLMENPNERKSTFILLKPRPIRL